MKRMLIVFLATLFLLQFHSAAAEKDPTIINSLSLLGVIRSNSCYYDNQVIIANDYFDDELTLIAYDNNDEYKSILYKGTSDFLLLQVNYDDNHIIRSTYVINQCKEDAFLENLAHYIAKYNKESKLNLFIFEREAALVHLTVNDYCDIIYDPYSSKIEYTYTFSNGNVYHITADSGKVLNITISNDKLISLLCSQE